MVFSTNKEIEEVIRKIGYKSKTPIQEALLPFKETKDIIGLAETGTGKTACFVIPVIEDLVEDLYGVHTLILTPTRELCIQTKEQVDIIGHYAGVKCEMLSGAYSIYKQVNAVQRKPHIVVVSPSRLSQMLCTAQTLNCFKKTRKIILDEADLLLNGDHSKHVFTVLTKILDINPRVQLMYFSATDIYPKISVKLDLLAKETDLDTNIKNIKSTDNIDDIDSTKTDTSDSDEYKSKKLKTEEYNLENSTIRNELIKNESKKNVNAENAVDNSKRPDKTIHKESKESKEDTEPVLSLNEIIERAATPELWKLVYKRGPLTIDTRTTAIPPQIIQEYSVVHKIAKEAHLIDLLNNEYSEQKVVVFVNRSQECAVLAEIMQEMGINAGSLTRLTESKERHEAFHKFRSGLLRVLVTTDIASRGIDIRDITLVINYDLPNDYVDYIHRIGRTGRLNTKGYALSFVASTDTALLEYIQKMIDQRITEKKLKPFSSPKLLNKISTHKHFILSRIQLHNK
ncbi:ATP-dependent RNA helicase DDX49/DBP8 [Nematocida sp. AWRm80]|nr:ATP-dependent RNA helicase DDX49/DBP8 [Nematocida sp. AWRm80]